MTITKTVKKQLSTHDSDIKTLIASLALSADVATLLSRIGTPAVSVSADIAVINGYVNEVEDLLKNVTYGLPALKTLIDAIPTTPELEADALSRYNTINGLLANATYGLSALRTTILLIPTTPELEADALSRYTTLSAYVDEIESLLKNVTYGLSALQVLLAAIPTTPELEASALSRYNTINDLLVHATYGLSALNTAIGLKATPAQALTQVQTEVGAFSARSNLTTLLASLGIPDTSNKPLYTVLVTDRLDNGTYGLSALQTQGGLVKTQTDKLPNVEFSTKWTTSPVADAIADPSAEQALTAGAITPTFPTGSTIVRVLLIASLHVTNRAATAHHIGIRVQGKKGAGEYATQGSDLTASAILGLVNVDGASDGASWVLDVSTLVDASASEYTFKFDVDSDAATAVTFTSEFTLILIYHM